MDPVALVVALLAGLAVIVLAWGLLTSSRPVAAERLEQLTGTQPVAAEPARAERPSMRDLVVRSPILTSANRLVERRSWSEDVARSLARADLTLTPIEYIFFRLAAILGMIALFVLIGQFFPMFVNPLVLIAAGVLGFVLPRVYIGRRQQARLNAFNAHLADTITLIANALRAGSSLLQAIELVVRETEPPVSTEFNRVIREVNLGLNTERALNNMVRRVRSADLELMATAIVVQYQVGGNLAEILDMIAFTIRERVRIKGEIRVLTAQQRVSGYVVGFLPVALLVVIALLAPSFMDAMFGPPLVLGIPLGVLMLASGALSMFVGFLLIRRIVDIEV